MNNKICKNLTKILIILIISSFLGTQSQIVYGMSFGGGEFPPAPSNGGGGGGGGSPTPPVNPTHPDANNDDQSIDCPHTTIRGFTGSVQEVIDSVTDTTIGKNSLGAEETKTIPLNYDDVKVTVSKKMVLVFSP